MVKANDGFVIADSLGLFTLSKDGVTAELPFELGWAKVIGLSDGGFVASGIGYSANKMLIKRFGRNLMLLAEGGLAPKSPEARLLEALSMAEGPDCSIVAVGRHAIGESVVDFWPAYMKFSANLK
jgi:hypothetical protein